jgi:hypothetical protein
MTSSRLEEAHGHPAVLAWCQLAGGCAAPERVVVLKRKAKGAVYRLVGVGLDGTDVIAKRCRRDKGVVERLVYQELYPQLPVPTLHFHGSVEEQDGEFWWLFLEDVGDEPYRPDLSQHRTLAGRWFGLANGIALELDLQSQLPDRGPDLYEGFLRDVCEALPARAADPSLDAAGRADLAEIVAMCERVARHWDRVEAFCADIPRTLVHGDCLRKNVHVRSTAAGPSLVPFDWGGAGWGLVATDLGQLALPYRGPRPQDPDLAAYLAEVEGRWPGLDRETVEQLANLGQMFWCLKVLSREIPAFDYEWSTTEATLANFRCYARALADAMRQASWLPGERAS